MSSSPPYELGRAVVVVLTTLSDHIVTKLVIKVILATLCLWAGWVLTTLGVWALLVTLWAILVTLCGWVWCIVKTMLFLASLAAIALGMVGEWQIERNAARAWLEKHQIILLRTMKQVAAIGMAMFLCKMVYDGRHPISAIGVVSLYTGNSVFAGALLYGLCLCCTTNC